MPEKPSDRKDMGEPDLNEEEEGLLDEVWDEIIAAGGFDDSEEADAK